MTWFKLDDSFHSHPKVLQAGNEAVGLYVRCGAYAAQHLTDGFIPEDVALLYGTHDLAESLVAAKLWRRARGGWRMPDYLDFNPSKEDVEKERKAKADRQKRWREKQSRRVTNGSNDGSKDAAPSRPAPTKAGAGTPPERASPSARPQGAADEARERAELRAAAINNCNTCDDSGYVGRRLCDHDPNAADRAKRGRHLVQVALRRESA